MASRRNVAASAERMGAVSPIISVSRALRLLEALSDSPSGLRITDVAQLLTVNKAIAFRLLAVLKDEGYVRQDDADDRYHATFKIAAVGLRKLDASRLTEWAQAPLDELAARTQELVRLAVAEDDRLRWIARSQGSNSRLIVDPASGADVTFHATASGKAWLSTLDRVSVERILRSEDLTPRTSRTRTDIRAVMADLQVVRERGYAMVFEEMDEGINAIAAPITSSSSRGAKGVGTVSVAGPSQRLDAARLESFAPALLSTSRVLGSQWAIYQHTTAARSVSERRSPDGNT